MTEPSATPALTKVMINELLDGVGDFEARMRGAALDAGSGTPEFELWLRVLDHNLGILNDIARTALELNERDLEIKRESSRSFLERVADEIDRPGPNP